MAKSKKRRKHKPQSPPLSALDNFMYVMLVIIHLALMFAVAVLFGFSIPSAFAYADDRVVAFNNIAALLLTLPLDFFLMISGIILSALGTQMRQPLFGNKKFKSKNDIPIKTVYPLFSKDYWKRMKRSHRSLLKTATSIYVVIFLICAAFIPFGICPRYTLDRENTVKEYNVFNSHTDSRNIENADKMVINISKRDRGIHSFQSSYQVQIAFVFEDDEYGFELGNFEKLDRKEALEYMIYLKSFFDGKYEITNIDRLYSLLDDNNYTAEEEKLIYELYEYGGTQN